MSLAAPGNYVDMAEAMEDTFSENEDPGTAACHAAGSQSAVVEHKCLLCDLAMHPDHGELSGVVSAFIADHVTRTQIGKIAGDVMAVLRENLPAHLVSNTTAADIITHIQTHTTNPTVIMTQVVRELVDLASVARESCILTCEETSRKMVNPRAAAVYLKTVSELQSALRHEALRVQKS